MRIWLKLLLCGAIGIALGVFLPMDGTGTTEVVGFLSTLAVNVSRFVILPLVFFGSAVAVYESHLERRLFAIYARAVGITLVTTVALIVVGILGVTILSPSRVPIVVERQVAEALPDFLGMVFQVIPRNAFLVLVENADFLLPVVFFSFFLGVNLTFDRNISHPAVLLLDSLSRVFYHMLSFITEIIGIGAIAMTAHLVLHLRSVRELELFLELFLAVGILAALVVVVGFPLALYLATGKKNPFWWLRSHLAPAIFALASGDHYAVLGLILRHGHEDAGIPRAHGGVILPFLGVIARSGTAMVTAICFIVILRSYSSLDISILQKMWVVGAAFVISLLLSGVPQTGLLVSLSLMSAAYGRGMEEGFLILVPAAVVLGRFATLLDAMALAFVSTLVADLQGQRRRPGSSHFI